MPKNTKTATKQRHDPLHVELSHGNGVLKSQPKVKNQRKIGKDNDESNQHVVDSNLSRKILTLAKQQQQEVDEEEEGEDLEEDEEIEEDSDYEDVSEDDEYEEYEEEIDEVELDPEDEELFNRDRMTLADKIMEKIKEKEQESPVVQPQERGGEGVMLPPKVIEVYGKVGELLSRYRDGKIPRVFKMIPSLKKWQDVLYVTQPESWSTQAVYQATKLFVSNLKSNQSEVFLETVLLPRFRNEVHDSKLQSSKHSRKNINYHIYRSLKKSLYKPAAFFKGFLFPLCLGECEGGPCTLREAVVIGSVLAKVSIPSLHSSAALLRLCEIHNHIGDSSNGPISLFIKVLLDKKYALPYKVIDGCVYHFMSFKGYQNDRGKPLPVIWHQSFLVFCQRYKNDLTEDQRDALLDVAKAQVHSSITPEIRREIISGQSRPMMDVEMS